MRIAAALLCILLTGCLWDAPPPVDIQVRCLPLKEYTPVQQASLAQEWAAWEAAHPGGITVGVFVPDAIKMRDADRACIASQTGK